MDQLLNLILTKETVFFGLFLYGYWMQQQDKVYQRNLIDQQQETLITLTKSVEKIAENQESMAEELSFVKTHVFMQTKGRIDNEK